MEPSDNRSLSPAGRALVALAVAIGQGEGWRWLGSIAGLLCAVTLASVCNWIAFGVGDRQFA